jgi:peptide/nickel transport system substrate-binding protein
MSVGLAGCTDSSPPTSSGSDGESNGEGSSDGGSNEESNTLKDDTLTLNQAVVPTDGQYNPWNGKNMGNPNLLLYDRLMYFNLQTKEYGPAALSEWDFTGDAITMTLRDDYTWHDGTEVTSEDLLTQLKLDMYTGGTLGDSVDSIADDVSTVDDKTVEIQFNQTFNEQIILGRLRDKRLYGYRDVYGDRLDDIESASSDDEQSSAISDLREWAYTDPVGNGPFQYEDAGSRRTLAVKYEDHPSADNINFPNVEWLYLESNTKRWSAIINNEVDGNKALFMPKNQLDQLPDNVVVNRIPVGRGVGIVINWNNEHLAKREVRQAMMHVINREEVATNSGGGTETKIPVDYPSGLSAVFSGRVQDHWLDGVVDQFEGYGRGSAQTDAATALMQEAGYEKDGNAWIDPSSGEQLSFEMKGPGGWPDWMTAGRTVASQLQDFGIDAQIQGKDTATYWGKDYDNTNFDLALNSVQAFGYTYPFFDYDWIYQSYDSNEVWGVPSTFEDVETLDGETTTVTPGDTVAELGSTESGSDEEMDLVQQLAYTTNQTLPGLPLVVKLRMSFMTTDDWNVPSADDSAAQVLRPPYVLPQRGEWTAKTE